METLHISDSSEAKYYVGQMKDGKISYISERVQATDRLWQDNHKNATGYQSYEDALSMLIRTCMIHPTIQLEVFEIVATTRIEVNRSGVIHTRDNILGTVKDHL